MLIQCAEQPVFLQCLGYCSPLVPILQPWQTSACKRRHTFSKIAAWVLVCKAQTIVSPVGTVPSLHLVLQSTRRKLFLLTYAGGQHPTLQLGLHHQPIN